MSTRYGVTGVYAQTEAAERHLLKVLGLHVRGGEPRPNVLYVCLTVLLKIKIITFQSPNYICKKQLPEYVVRSHIYDVNLKVCLITVIDETDL